MNNSKPRYGVIDLGTNTFHLLIVEVNSDGTFEELIRKRVYIKLAEEGIETIGEVPFKRGIDALNLFHTLIKANSLTALKAFGTAALRTASNGPNFIQQVKQNTGIDIQLIPGSEEARLIHQGVAQAVPFDKHKVLIMDIGGGSVEFIIADEKHVYWAESFPIGVAVLFNQFHQNDPISIQEIDTLKTYLEKTLTTLLVQLEKTPARYLVGASGTFDVLEAFLVKQKKDPLHSSIKTEKLYPFYNQLITTTLEERLAIVNLPASRAEMIIVAMVLIRFIIEKASLEKVIISAYAMKEGMLKEMIQPK